MGSILASLHIDSGTLPAEVLNFVLLFVFLRIFAWPPLVKMMEQRRKTIEGQLAAAEDERQEAVRLRERQNEDLAEARTAAAAILERSQRAATEQARQILDEAKTQAERLHKQAAEDVARERDAAIAALRGEVADLVLLATSHLLRARVDEARDRELVEGFIASAQGGGR